MITTTQQVNYWLALTAIPKIGVATLLSTAIHQKLTLATLHTSSNESLEAIGWTSEQVACLHEANPFTQRTIEWLKGGVNRYLISYDCAEYPPQLKEIAQPPLLLFLEGNINLLNMPQLAIVGSRKPTAGGLNALSDIISQLVSASNMVVTSGLALGVDAHSHKVCLANQANTIAVLGCGIDVIYPQRHKALYTEIKARGLLVSEFPPSVLPIQKHFPRRNRIISGLSWGTLVAEAQIKSGSLVTAKYAAEQGREVLAMPSNIHNPKAKGCHWLIKQGAKLVECAQDILEEAPSFDVVVPLKVPQRKKPKQCLASTPLLDSVASVDTEDSLLLAIDFDVTSIDEIAKRSGEAIPALLTKLLEYELRGIVASTSEGYLKLRA